MTDNSTPFDMLLDQIRAVVREEIESALSNTSTSIIENDKLLTPGQAATIINVKIPWLYRHAGKLPFTRRISRKQLRFSEPGLRRWLASRKP